MFRYTVVIALVCWSSFGVADRLAAQDPAEVAVMAAVLDHLSERWPAEKSAVVVIDPGVLDPFESLEKDLARAQEVADVVGARVATLHDVTACPDSTLARYSECRLMVDRVVRFSKADMRGDHATISVAEWWSEPGLRDPIPMTVRNVVLARDAHGWRVTEMTLDFRS